MIALKQYIYSERAVKAIEKVIDRIHSGYYTVRDGRLINRSGKVLSQIKRGYNVITVHFGTKKNGHPDACYVLVHRALFAYYYGINELLKYETINHIDGDKLNNRKENLEGATIRENVKHSLKTGLRKVLLTFKEVQEIKKLAHLGYSASVIADLYDIDYSHVSSICTGRRYKDVPLDLDVEIIRFPKYKSKRFNRKSFPRSEAISLYKKGLSASEIAKKFGISKSAIHKLLKNHRRIS